MRATGREKTFLGAGVCLLAVVVAVQFLFLPALKRARELERLVPQKERELKEMRLLRGAWESLKERRAAVAQKIPAGEQALSPLARLDGLIERNGLRQNVRSIKPTPAAAGGPQMTIVEIALEKTDLQHLTRFLYELQSLAGLQVARLAVKPRYTTPRYLDVNLQLNFYQG